MVLTTEQIGAVADGQPVALTPPEIGQACVLLRADVYARLRSVGSDALDLDPRVAYPAVLKAWDAEGCPEDAELYRT